MFGECLFFFLKAFCHSDFLSLNPLEFWEKLWTKMTTFLWPKWHFGPQCCVLFLIVYIQKGYKGMLCSVLSIFSIYFFWKLAKQFLCEAFFSDRSRILRNFLNFWRRFFPLGWPIFWIIFRLAALSVNEDVLLKYHLLCVCWKSDWIQGLAKRPL